LFFDILGATSCYIWALVDEASNASHLYCKLVLSILNTSPTCFDHVVLSNINVDQSALGDFFRFFLLHIECDVTVIRIVPQRATKPWVLILL
jgi:hypothetical protein